MACLGGGFFPPPSPPPLLFLSLFPSPPAFAVLFGGGVGVFFSVFFFLTWGGGGSFCSLGMAQREAMARGGRYFVFLGFFADLSPPLSGGVCFLREGGGKWPPLFPPLSNWFLF